MKDMSINEKIKYLRNLHGLTLEEVGNAVGVGKSTVRKWESGDIKNMRRDKIASLAAALHTTPAYLMGWEEQENKPSETEELTADETKFIELLRQASPQEREIVMRILNK